MQIMLHILPLPRFREFAKAYAGTVYGQGIRQISSEQYPSPSYILLGRVSEETRRQK